MCETQSQKKKSWKEFWIRIRAEFSTNFKRLVNILLPFHLCVCVCVCVCVYPYICHGILVEVRELLSLLFSSCLIRGILMFSLCCVPQANWPSSFKKFFCQLEVVVHSFYPSTWEAEMGRSLWVDGQPGVQIEFQGSQDWWHSHKTIPHQFRIMNSKRVIYLREKRTGHCPI